MDCQEVMLEMEAVEKCHCREDAMGALPAHLPNTTDASRDTSYVSIPRLGLTLIGRFCLTNQNV